MDILSEIRAGKALRKVPESEKRDRSTLDAAKTTKPSSTQEPAKSSNSATAAPPMGLGGLFANGMPRLRPSGARTSLGDSSAPPPPAEPVVQPRGLAPPTQSHAPPPPPPPTEYTRPSPLTHGSVPPPPRPPVSQPPSAPLSSTPSFAATANKNITRPTVMTPTSASQPPPPVTHKKPVLNGTRKPQSFRTDSCLRQSSEHSSLGHVTKPQAPLPPGASMMTQASVPSAAAAAAAASGTHPPSTARGSSASRSQRIGVSTSEDGAPLERPANAKPKLIHINSQTSRPGASFDGGSMPAPPVPPSAYVAQPLAPKTHPPAPQIPHAQSQMAGLASDFERRFRFRSDDQLPPPPLPYSGPRTYRCGKGNTSTPRRTAPTEPPRQ